MGSFAGHIDEAIFFLVIGIWWMFNSFPRYIRSALDHQQQQRQYVSQLSYRLPCTKRNVPIEAILKTVFPVCGFAAELWSRGPAFVDQDGQFRKLEEVQHMSIYALFIAHGIIDILTSYRCPLPAGLDYLSGAVAFGWYGFSFSMHSNMPGKSDMERMVHTLPVPVMLAIAACMLLELFHARRSFLVQLARAYFLLVLGTYFTHVSFILFRHDVFPGWQRNPQWDQDDHRNVHFIVAAFGFHLCLHVVTVTVTYLLAYVAVCCSRSTGRRDVGRFNGYERPDKVRLEKQNGNCYDEEDEDYTPLVS